MSSLSLRAEMRTEEIMKKYFLTTLLIASLVMPFSANAAIFQVFNGTRLSFFQGFRLAAFYPIPASSAPVLVAHTGNGTSSGSVVTAAINTTGANLIVVKVSWYSGSTANGTLTDSKGNTWTALTRYNESVLPMATRLFYASSPTTDAAQTFTWTGASTFANVEVQAWSGMSSSPFDVENGATNGNNANTTIQPGSITPSQSNCIFITGLGHENNSGGARSINSSFTISDSVAYVGGTTEGGAMAYKVSTSGTAENPTWNFTNSVTSSQADIACFKY